jgi:hypothetical protein
VLAGLDSPALRRALAAPHDDVAADLLKRLHTDEDALAELEVAHFADGHLSRAGYLAVRRKLPTRIDATRRSLARRDRTGVLLQPADERGDAPSRVGRLRVEWRRGLLAAVMDLVKVRPAVKGRNFGTSSTRTASKLSGASRWRSSSRHWRWRILPPEGVPSHQWEAYVGTADTGGCRCWGDPEHRLPEA